MSSARTRAEALLSRESSPLSLPRTPRGELSPFGPPSSTQRFLPFLPAHLQRAMELAARFMALARPSAVLDEAEREASQGDPEWVKYALRVFIAHHPEGRELSVPPLAERAPQWVKSSGRTMPLKKSALGTPGAEVWLDYFREDTGLNDFLDTRHVLFPATGHPDPASPERRILPEGHGERFGYTYQQLLARYDTERLAFGMPRVAPLEDYASPINEGYDARLPGFAPRPAGLSPRDLPGYGITDHATRRDRLFLAASSGLLWRDGAPHLIDRLEQLADTAESNPGSIDGERWAEPLGPYGAHHQMGLVLLACLTAPQDRSGLPGVLASPATAARDPLFFRWHRHVDDILDAWQSTHQPPHDLSEGPGARMRKWLGDGNAPAHQSPDILLGLESDLPESTSPGFDGQRWGQARYGGENWDSPPPSFRETTHTLRTRMVAGEKPRLDHDPFHFFLRVENPSPRERKVTVRIYLAADAFAEDRRMWMELDTFVHTLPASERTVIYRPSRLASVVREGGWPAHLLLPRGRNEGMLFRLMVLLTDWERDTAEDSESQEPGFPFNRPLLPGQRIADWLALPHVATRNVWIHHVAP